jgi:thioredoxin-like negative regulator of GroEL
MAAPANPLSLAFVVPLCLVALAASVGALQWELARQARGGDLLALEWALAGVHLARGADGEAQALISDMMGATGPNARLAAAQAGIHLRAGRVGRAVAAYETLLKADPGDPAARFGLAIARWQAGDRREAVEHLRALAERRDAARAAWGARARLALSYLEE